LTSGERAVALRSAPGAMPLGLVFLVVGVVAAAAVAVLHLDQLPIGFCAFKAVTGWPCLTCGTTRAVGRLAALDVGGALAMNPLVTAFAFLLVPWGLGDLALARRGRALALRLSPLAGRVARVAGIVALAVNWIYLVAAGR
jgi:hypothetical protein